MKRSAIISITICLLIIAPLYAQYSFEMKLDNYYQVNETEVEWEIFLRKGSGSADFALYTMQFRFDFNNEIMNGGSFENEFLNIISSGTELHQKSGWFQDIDFTIVGTYPNRQINWGTTNAPAGGEKVTVISSTWLKVATFRAQLRKNGNPHNFANLDPRLAFEVSGSNVLVRRCDWTGVNPNALMSGEINYSVPRAGTIPELSVPVNTRQLAGYWFSGNGLWTETTRWNNVTTENKNTLPLAHANAIINGNATIPDGSTISMTPSEGNGGELTVLTGEEQLYTLTGTINHSGAGGLINIWSDGVGSTNLGNPTTLASGTTVTLQAIDFLGAQNISWTTNPPESGSFGNSSALITTFIMPANNVEVIATMSSKKSENVSSNHKAENLNTYNKNSLFASLTLDPGASLTVDKLFNDNINGAEAIQLLSTSTANASLIHNNTGVPATVKRTFSLPTKFHFISSPITGAVSLNTVFPADQSNIWVRVWNEAGGAWVNQLADNHSMSLGLGYSFYMNIASTTAIFEGTLNTEAVTVSLSNTGGTGDLNKDGWNLIGNPFSSSVNLTSVVIPNTTGQVAVWSGTAGNYLTSQGGSGSLPSHIVPPNQAMFVKATAAGTTTIPASARTHASQALHKDNGSSPAETLRLDITNEDNAYRDAAFIRFHPEATQGFDNYLDAHKLFGETKAPQLFFTADDLNLSIHALPAIEDNMEIPLNVRTGVHATHTISASGIESFDPAQAIFLKDLLTGVLTDLRLESNYSFQPITGNETPGPRFAIQFYDATLDAPDTEDETIRLFSYDKTVYAYTPEVTGATLALTNMLGQKVFQTVVNGAGLHSFETGLSPGLYILSLQTENMLQSKQIIIK